MVGGELEVSPAPVPALRSQRHIVCLSGPQWPPWKLSTVANYLRIAYLT